MKKKRSEPSMAELANAAFMEAAESVIKLAEDTGTPVIIWKNGKIAKVKPQDLRKSRKANGQYSGD